MIVDEYDGFSISVLIFSDKIVKSVSLGNGSSSVWRTDATLSRSAIYFSQMLRYITDVNDLIDVIIEETEAVVRIETSRLKVG